MADPSTETDLQHKAQTRASWAGGDYDRFARSLVWELGGVLVDACGLGAGDRVLDVACGSGSAALRAAAAGADVVACDLTPENFPPGQRAAASEGLAIEWVEADAEAMPFTDHSFDVVMSSVGAMWTPDHQRVADEMVRVCRPGGRIAMVNFAAGGLLGSFLEVFSRYAPPPPAGATSPLQWGDRRHLSELFDGQISGLEVTDGSYVERVPGGPEGYRAFYQETFGPLVALRAALADQPERLEELDRDFLEFAARADRGAPGGPAELTYEYVLVRAQVR